jgi:uncharacterized membrane protein YqjE
MSIGDRPRRESVISLARRMVRGAIALAQLELQRGRQEVGEAMSSNARAAALFGAAAFLALLALIALVVLIVALLALLLPLWLAALIVLAAFLVLALILALLGRGRVRNPMPQETIEAVKEDLAWARRLLRRE